MPFGLFEYFFTPFGLSNAAQAFQRMMDRTTDGLEGVFAYKDDSPVGFPDRQTYLLHLEDFFNALATMVSPSISKNVFLQCPLWRFLATRIRRQDWPPQPVMLLKLNLAPPKDIKQLQCFLSMVNFYRRFLPNCAQVLRPLTDLLRGGGGVQNVGVDRHGTGGFPECKAPPSSGSTPPTSRPTS
jgi:putative transposase